VADVKLGLEDDFNELEGTVCAVGETHVEKKAKLKDRLLQAQARAALEGLLLIVSPCDAKRSGQHTKYVQDLRRPRFVRSSCLLSQYNVLQLRIYNHTERAPRIADFGRRLTGLLRNWMAIGMDLGFAIIHMQLLMLMFHIWSF
jgi:hypothetical protein